NAGFVADTEYFVHHPWTRPACGGFTYSNTIQKDAMILRRLRPRALGLPLLAAATIAAAPAPAQVFPSHAVKIVVPTSPGGATDAFARALATRLSAAWGPAVLVEKRARAHQMLGADFVSKSAPDGYALLVSDASSFVINPHLYKKLPYDGLHGFTPITVLVRFPWVIAVNASVPANTFQELVAYAKANPGKLSYGSFG